MGNFTLGSVAFNIAEYSPNIVNNKVCTATYDALIKNKLKYVINAVEIDWNGAETDYKTINNTGDLICYINEAYNGLKNSIKGVLINNLNLPVNDEGIAIGSLEFEAQIDLTNLVGKKYGAGEIFNDYSGNEAKGEYSHAEGYITRASAAYTHAEGYLTIALGISAHTEGYVSLANGHSSHAEGYQTEASGPSSHSEGHETLALHDGDHAEGYKTTAKGVYSHAEGYYTKSLGSHAHAEGSYTSAEGSYSHAEGYKTTAVRDADHAEGRDTIAKGMYSHAEGYYTKALGSYSHAEGYNTTAKGSSSHSGGHYTNAIGAYSFAHGDNLFAYDYLTVFGRYNKSNENAAFIIGGPVWLGTTALVRNIMELDWDGNLTITGTINGVDVQNIGSSESFVEEGSLTLLNKNVVIDNTLVMLQPASVYKETLIL